MILEYDNYRLKKSSNGLSWELYEYKTVEPKDKSKEKYKDWVSMGKYPSTLGHGLAIIYECELKKGNKVTDLKTAITTAKRLHKELMEVKLKES